MVGYWLSDHVSIYTQHSKNLGVFIMNKIHYQCDRHDLKKAIEAMPQPHRKILILRKTHGLTQQSIAQETNLSERAVEKYLAESLLFLMGRVNEL